MSKKHYKIWVTPIVKIESKLNTLAIFPENYKQTLFIASNIDGIKINKKVKYIELIIIQP